MHRRRAQSFAALACLALVACTGTTPRAAPATDAVVVASFDFAESRLLAEVYAQALTAAGVPVRREAGLGPRELVLPALRQGLVDVVPEYLGSALTAVTLGGVEPPTDAGAAREALADALRPDGLTVLRPAAAQDQNGLAVTRATAERLSLRSTSDLVHAAPALALAGPPECPGRPFCLPGLSRVYGLRFARFVAYDSESQRVTALRDGVVDVIVVFTTDGAVAAGDAVLLDDDRHLQPAENVAPVVSQRALRRFGERVATTLDAVSSQLDQAGLTFLDWRVQIARGSPQDEARGWLLRHDLVTR